MALGHSRPIKKEDLIINLLDYFESRLKEKSLNDLKEMAYQIILRENKELERKVCQIYRQIIRKQDREYKARFNELN